MPKSTHKKERRKNSIDYSFLKKLVDEIPVHVYWKDIQGNCLGCNLSQARSLGFSSPEEVVGKTMHELFPKEDADRVTEIDKKVINSGKPLICEEVADIDSYGREAIFLSHKLPLKDVQGKVVGLLGISCDITDYKKEERDLRTHTENTERTLEAIIKTMPGHVYWKNRKGVFLGCNTRQAKSFGVASWQDIIGKTDYELLSVEDAERVTRIDAEVMNFKKEYILEEIGIYNKQEVTFLSHKVPLIDKAGNVTGILGVSFDITDRKKAEAVKTKFMSVVNSELRRPLGNVIELHDVMRMEIGKNKRLSHYFDLADNELDQALKLLENVSYLLELDKGNIRRKAYEIDMRASLDGLLDKLCVPRNVKRKLKIDKSVPELILVDIFNLEKVLGILLENAARFTKKGSITIKASAKNGRLKISVEDTGCGIPKTQQKKLFKIFSSTEALINNEHSYERICVRLPIAQKLIELIDGTLTVSSRPNVGTKMTVVVPYKPVKLNKKLLKELLDHRRRKVEKEENIPLPKLRILIVEDSPVTRMGHSILLKGLGCIVSTAETGEQAIALAKTQKFDLVFLDIHLPDVNGMEVAKRLRSISEELDIVAVTVNASEADVENFQNHGILTTIHKPASRKKFLEFLQMYAKAMQDVD